MNKRLLIATGLLFFATISLAQEVPGAVEKKKGCSCTFSSIFNLGILEGERGAQFQLQTVQGIRYAKWFGGVGVGLDYYGVRSIPVFVDLRRDLFNTKNTPFIYADGGMHFPWASSKDKPQWGKNKFDGGMFYDVGLGYRVGAGKQGGFLISAGFSHKYVKESRITPVCVAWRCAEETSEYFKYRFNRLSLKAGWQL